MIARGAKIPNKNRNTKMVSPCFQVVNRALGALYLGYYKDNTMHYAGKVGTGFTMQSAADYVAAFDRIAIKKPLLKRTDMPDVPTSEYHKISWVRPDMLCEVSFTEWTDDGHIRHPSFEGMRSDKRPKQVKEEKPMKVENAVKAAKEKPTKKAKDALVLDGVTITHPDRVISETGHITKGELAEYYAKAAPYMLQNMARHPISLLRCPDGVGEGIPGRFSHIPQQ